MKYIDNLVKFSNNELDFQKELLKIKSDIKDSENPYREVNLLIKNMDKYCEKRIKDNCPDNSSVHVLESDDFCMFIFNRLLNKAKNDFEIHKETMLELLGDKSLPSDVNKTLKERFVHEVFMIIDICFTQGTDYYLKKVENNIVVELVNRLVQSMNTEILFEVSGLNPILFVAEEGNKEGNITKLGIILLIIDKKQLRTDMESYLLNLHTTITNQLVESCMKILLEDILFDSDTEYLIDKYSIDEDELQITIGKEIAKYLCKDYNEYTPLLNDVIKLSHEGRAMKKEVEKHMYNMASNRQINF